MLLLLIYSLSFLDVLGISQTRKKDPPLLGNSRSKHKDDNKEEIYSLEAVGKKWSPRQAAM